MKEAGYVYILTNPSFKEDWVKIGMSSHSVEQRVKQLDGTAVPLPFEIYATMRTVKYKEAEKLIHRYIERFTNLRIRDNREFFNVSPEEALAIFRDVETLLDDAKIEVYQSNNNISNYSEPSNCDDIFKENITIREDIADIIKNLIDPDGENGNKFIIRHFKGYSTISYEKNWLWFVRIYFNRTWDKAYLSFPNHMTGAGEIDKTKIDGLNDVNKYSDNINQALKYIIDTYIFKKR